jgi:hypothetical protein
MNKYLFITEGGDRDFVIDGEITEEDRKCVTAGILTIYRLGDLCELSQQGEWIPIPTGKSHEGYPNEGIGPFHYTD